MIGVVGRGEDGTCLYCGAKPNEPCRPFCETYDDSYDLFYDVSLHDTEDDE